MTAIGKDRVRLTAAEMHALTLETLTRVGYDADEARIIADHTTEAALSGYEDFGLPKVLNVIDHRRLRDPRRAMRTVRETPVSLLVDGGNNCGMITMEHATRALIAKVQVSGIAVLGMFGSFVSGRVGHYVEMVARAGMVGIHTVGTTPHVAPPGGAAKILGTNPIAVGLPANGDPVVIDVGTSAITATDVELHARTGAPLPAGVAVDAGGRPTTDAHAALTGAILHFGGHKGYALGFAAQALAVLAGAGLDPEKSYGYLLIAIRPDILVPLDDFKRDLAALIERIKAIPKQPGVAEIRIPSERTFRERAKNLRAGLEVDRVVYESMRAAPAGILAPRT